MAAGKLGAPSLPKLAYFTMYTTHCHLLKTKPELWTWQGSQADAMNRLYFKQKWLTAWGAADAQLWGLQMHSLGAADAQLWGLQTHSFGGCRRTAWGAADAQLGGLQTHSLGGCRRTAWGLQMHSLGGCRRTAWTHSLGGCRRTAWGAADAQLGGLQAHRDSMLTARSMLQLETEGWAVGCRRRCLRVDSSPALSACLHLRSRTKSNPDLPPAFTNAQSQPAASLH
eukprot:366277-Chlamydomonas_euryale.AAC.3